jgi:tetratricopeptide (TPR) repeat protein
MLAAKGEREEAIREYRTALALDPKLAQAHVNLGITLDDKGEREEAIQELRTAITIDPKHAQAHGALGMALLQQGQFNEARNATQACLQLLPAKHPLRQLVTQQLQQCQQMIALDEKLPAILKGEAKPANASEAVTLAAMCQQYKKRYVAAVRLYTDAFAAEPKWANDPQAAHRYNAACSPALGAAGQGQDAGKLGDKERARLRKQTLGWLRADLDLWAKQAENGKPPVRAVILKTLQHWQKDTDLAGLRDTAALAKLSDAERADFQKLWADVAALVKKCSEKDKP